MQAFICPQCSQRSSFDPWVESAHCPLCGALYPEKSHKELPGWLDALIGGITP
jgi:hypothetical protein